MASLGRSGRGIVLFLRISPFPRSGLSRRRGMCSVKKDDKEDWTVEKLRGKLRTRVEELRSRFTPSGDETLYYEKVNFWMRRYENFIGISDVKASQTRVVQAEKEFIESQERRREMQVKISELRNSVKSIHSELEKTYRGEDRYIVLVTQEHQVLKEERLCLEEFKRLERAERDSFSSLSNAVRDSHEKERAQAEKTKYWSVIGSIVGTCLGILGTTINNRMRMNELRDLVSRSGSGDLIREAAQDILSEVKNRENLLFSLSAAVENATKEFVETVGQMETTKGPEVKGTEAYSTRKLETSISNLSYHMDTIISSLTKKYDGQFKTTKDELHKMENNINTHFQKTNQRVEDILKREEHLEEKIKDIRSLLLSQSWGRKAQECAPSPEYERYLKSESSNKAHNNGEIVVILATLMVCGAFVYSRLF